MVADQHAVMTAVVLPPEFESVSAARGWLADWLEGRDMSPSRVGDAELVLSELTTNVIRHGAGDIVCHASVIDEDSYCLAVIDVGPQHPQVVDRGSFQIGGLGLHIVERLAEVWGVAEFPGGKAVWVVLRFGELGSLAREYASAG